MSPWAKLTSWIPHSNNNLLGLTVCQIQFIPGVLCTVVLGQEGPLEKEMATHSSNRFLGILWIKSLAGAFWAQREEHSGCGASSPGQGTRTLIPSVYR